MTSLGLPFVLTPFFCMSFQLLLVWVKDIDHELALREPDPLFWSTSVPARPLAVRQPPL